MVKHFELAHVKANEMLQKDVETNKTGACRARGYEGRLGPCVPQRVARASAGDSKGRDTNCSGSEVLLCQPHDKVTVPRRRTLLSNPAKIGRLQHFLLKMRTSGLPL